MAVVVGPFGDDLRLARQVIEMIDAPIVLGVDPRRPFAAQVAELGGMFDREAVLQFSAPPPPLPTPTASDDPTVTPPPRPRPPPPPDLEAGLTAMPKAVAAAWIGDGPSIPRADRGLLAGADKHQLPFVGDRGDKRPAALPMPIALVEDEKRPEALSEQLQKIADTARRYGRVVVVAAPGDATIDALQATLPQWRQTDLDVVPLSTLVVAVPATPPADATAGHAGGTALSALVGTARCGTRSAPRTRVPVLRVSELNRLLRTCLEAAVPEVWVAGEISNLRVHTSGHCYFRLKDADGADRGGDVPLRRPLPAASSWRTVRRSSRTAA